jgi:hypothetical protein
MLGAKTRRRRGGALWQNHESMNATARYPLLFTYRDTLFGPGFVVEVVTEGRALAVREDDDEFWVYGVNPGALAASGSSLAEAHAAFRSAYRQVLLDTAATVGSFEEFKADAERFFADTDADLEAWHSAVQDVRAGHIDAPLPHESADTPRSIRVALKAPQAVSALDNQAQVVVEALAA